MVNLFELTQFICLTRKVNARFALARALDLKDLSDPIQKKVLASVCKKLEDSGFADDSWDENNLIESSYKEQGLKRYKTLYCA